MASLKFIMDVNDDHQPDTRHTNKKDATPANAGQLQLQLLEEGTNTPPHPGHVSSSSGLVVEHQNHINPAVPNPQTTTNINKRRAVSTRGPKSTTTALPAPLSSSTSSSAAIPSISSELSPLSTSVSTSRPPARRRSTASVDSMDQTGYGSAASSSSMGHGLHHPNQPMRPMPPHPQGNEIPMRLTPITGRVSRAKKGVPVHVCDLCKPAKTFTRAEHLRRHQLSHQNPGYACTYPGCERAFHRPDLLARHQQRHDVEGDKASKSGGHEGDRGVSSARSSMDDGYRGGQLQQSASGSSSAISGSGAGSMASSSATGISSTPNASENQRRYSEMSSSTATGSPATPRAMGGGGASAYRSSGSASRHGDYNSYPMPSSTVSIIDPTHSSSISGGYPGVMDYQTPRSASQSMNIMSTLPTLLIPEHNKTPELSYAHDGASPWTSSASDSTYSTPASDIPRRAWMRPRSPAADWPTNTHQLLSPYPGTAPRNLQNPGGGLDTMPSMYANSNQYSTSSYTHAPAHQQQSYYDVSMNPYGSAAGPGQHGTYRSHHQHSTSISSIPSPIQASNTSSSHIGEALIAPAAHPGRLDPLLGLGRQKELAMATHPSLMDSQTMGGLGVLDGMYGSLDGGRSTGDNEGAILTALDMPIGGGCSMAGPGMGHPLQRSVRESIPGYLSTYWDKVHPVLPVVHRQSFEAGPDDALRCAMAAVATQYLNSKEDRTRGNQLHEFAWHEAKRVTSWNMQTMQAILLLEYFARFRGRKAVTKPSKLFESLYSRVLYQNPAMFNNTDADSHLPTEERWRTWLDMEARRRLLAGCFHLDGHAATYQQQLRAHDFDADGMTPIPPVPLFSRSADLWNASSADEWAAILDAFPDKGIPLFAPSSEQLTPEMVMSQTPYDRMAILGIEMLRLPRRQPVAASSSAHSSPLPDEAQLPTDPQLQNYGSQQPTSCAPEPLGLDVEDHISKLFAKCPIGNTYLALHHTPLQDLLAVGGDSWVFSQKVLPATSFLEHQKRLKLWTEQHSRPSAPFSANNNNNSGIANLSAIRATVYAARAILLFLERGPGSSWSTDLSDYWALYVCALIIWAFGHRARPVPTSDARHHGHHQRNSSGGSISSAPASRLSSAAAVAVAADEEAIGWLRTVAAEGVRLEDVVRLRARREAAGVVGLVMRRLEADCVGGRSRLYVDAVGVLRKLDVEVIRKWF